jgi:hypothetical protein
VPVRRLAEFDSTRIFGAGCGGLRSSGAHLASGCRANRVELSVGGELFPDNTGACQEAGSGEQAEPQARVAGCGSGWPSGILRLTPFRDTHMSDEELKAEVEKLRAENERLKSQRGRSVSLKVSEKGGVSVYGLGRFPVTLYKEQWAKLLAMADEIRAFLKEHDGELKAKPE